jgi:hypothetical protein
LVEQQDLLAPQLAEQLQLLVATAFILLQQLALLHLLLLVVETLKF